MCLRNCLEMTAILHLIKYIYYIQIQSHFILTEKKMKDENTLTAACISRGRTNILIVMELSFEPINQA